MPNKKSTVKLPSQDRLRELFSYNAKTGALIWNTRPETDKWAKLFNARFAGNSAGGPRTRGKNTYLTANLDGKPRYVHRIIFKWVTGLDPECIDHVDGNGLNNRWSNLRLATEQQNQGNKKAKTGRKYKKGTRKVGNRWAAFMTKERRFVHLGYHNTETDAHAAYCVAAKEYFGEFFRAK